MATKNTIRMAVLALGLVLVGSTTATALINVGDPWTGNSWGQRFDHQTGLVFETVRIDWMFGSSFELPTVFENFDDDSWTAGWENPSVAGALGDVTADLGFDVLFSGDIVPTGFTLATYAESAAQQYFDVRFEQTRSNDWRWTVTEMDPTGAPGPLHAPNPIPEPGMLLLLGAGLVGLAGARMRRRRG